MQIFSFVCSLLAKLYIVVPILYQEKIAKWMYNNYNL